MLVIKLYICLLIVIFVPIIIGSIIINYIPNTKVGRWVKRNIITDQDLDNP